MPVLHLDNVPDELYGRIQDLATAAQVPVKEETLRLLRQAVDLQQPANRASVLEILQELRQNRIVPGEGTPDSVELLREDRER